MTGSSIRSPCNIGIVIQLGFQLLLGMEEEQVMRDGRELLVMIGAG